MTQPTATLPTAAHVHFGRTVAMSAQDGEKALPARIKLFDWGENTGRTTGARIVVNDQTLSVLSANQEICALDDVELDYEHQSVEGFRRYKEPPRASAAHGRIEVIEGEGVFLTGLDYTPNGKEFALNYPDVSAVAVTDADDNLILVRSVALTQKGDVAAAKFKDAVLLSALLGDPEEKSNQPTMENNTKFRDLLVAMFKLTPAEGEESVSDEQIVAAAEAFQSGDPLSADPDKKPEDDASTDTTEVALTARFDAFERKQIIRDASSQGKVIPLSAEQIAETPVHILSAMVEKLPGNQVPVDGAAGTTEKPQPKTHVLSADEKKVCANMGLTEEAFIKANYPA